MFHLLFLSGCYLGILVIGLGPARAQTRDVPNATTAETASQIALKNLSGEAITRARIRTKQGHEWDMSAGGGLANNQATQVVVPARECIDSVEVLLKSGRKMQASNLNSCNETQVVVSNDSISIPQQAIPGAQERGTPR
jgi:hypothetical protein